MRPKGQYRDATGAVVFGHTKKLDYELEIAAIIGAPSIMGEPVSMKDADDHIFGLVLLNDWSGKFGLPLSFNANPQKARSIEQC